MSSPRNSRKPWPSATSARTPNITWRSSARSSSRRACASWDGASPILSLINMNNIPKDKVGLGSTVKVFDSTKNEEIEYQLVTSEETDVALGQNFHHFADRARLAE